MEFENSFTNDTYFEDEDLSWDDEDEQQRANDDLDQFGYHDECFTVSRFQES
jgi:hypothetical protein